MKLNVFLQLELVVSLMNTWLKAVPSALQLLRKKQRITSHEGTPIAEQPTEPPQSTIVSTEALYRELLLNASTCLKSWPVF